MGCSRAQQSPGVSDGKTLDMVPRDENAPDAFIRNNGRYTHLKIDRTAPFKVQPGWIVLPKREN